MLYFLYHHSNSLDKNSQLNGPNNEKHQHSFSPYLLILLATYLGF